MQDKGTASQDLLPTASWAQLRDFQQTGTTAVVSLNLGGVSKLVGGVVVRGEPNVQYSPFTIQIPCSYFSPSASAS